MSRSKYAVEVGPEGWGQVALTVEKLLEVYVALEQRVETLTYYSFCLPLLSGFTLSVH